MKIRTKIQLLLSTILLLTASCSACEQRDIKDAPDAYGAKLATQQATLGGGVVHNRTLHLLIEVNGTIQENFHKEQTLAGIIVIPTGDDIKKAAEELKDTAHPQEVNTCTELLGDKGFAYYDSHVAEKQQGAVTIKAFIETIPLRAATTYEAYFILRRTQTGCVYYSPAGMSFKTPDFTAFPTIQMQPPVVKKDATATIQLDLSSNILSSGTSTIKKQGFLLTKQGGTNVEPRALVASLLRKNQSLPTATGLQPCDSNPDAIHAAGTISGAAIQALNILDTSNLLQRGATYDVCSYAVCEDHGQDYYIFSQNTESAKILKTLAELKMDRASVVELQKVEGDSSFDKLVLQFVGRITKQEDTKSPIIGFLATQTSDRDTAQAIVHRLLPSLSSSSPYYRDPASNDIIFNVRPATASITWRDDVTALLAAMVGKSYYAYCWLADGGEVFVSDSKELKVPQAIMSVDSVTSTSNPANPLLIDININIRHKENLSNRAHTGLLFVKVGTSLDQTMLKGSSLSNISRDVVLLYEKEGDTTELFNFNDNNFKYFDTTTQYHVYALLQSDSALFVSPAASDTLKTAAPSSKTVCIVSNFSAVKGVGPRNYTIDTANHTIIWNDTTGGLGNLIKGKNCTEIKAVLGKIYIKSGSPDTTEINNFISHMFPYAGS